jgi:hypothetical protein
MEFTASFVDLLQHFGPVFTTPTFQTFLQIVAGWVLSHRHRYVTEVIFAGGNVGNGHWCRFHRFFSHATWDMDILALFLAKLVGTVLAPGSTLFWAVDETLCRKRGLTLRQEARKRRISSNVKPFIGTLRVTNPVRQSWTSSRKRVLRGGGVTLTAKRRQRDQTLYD